MQVKVKVKNSAVLKKALCQESTDKLRNTTIDSMQSFMCGISHATFRIALVTRTVKVSTKSVGVNGQA